MKILLCEDDLNIVMIVQMALESLGGHSVDVANDGLTALEKAKSGVYDLILLDDMMPHMSGPDVCKNFAETKPEKSKIIFMSANNQSAKVAEFKGLVLGYIAKPFDPMELNSRIESLAKLGASDGRAA